MADAGVDGLTLFKRELQTGEPLAAFDTEQVSYQVELTGAAAPEDLEQLVAHVDEIAEIPNSVRQGTEVKLAAVNVVSTHA